MALGYAGSGRRFFAVADQNLVSYNGIIIDDIKNAYPLRLKALKDGIYAGQDLAASRIDRHKVVALYIQLCLERQVFKLPPSITASSGIDAKTMLINEMFCLRLAKNTLEGWSGKQLDTKKLKQEYMPSFLKLLWHYRDKAEFQKHKEFFTYALAHVIYFIERDFMA